jgi:hypothetical protein
MKITRNKLKEFITEEIKKSHSMLLEAPSTEGAYSYEEASRDEKEHAHEPVDLARQSLFHMAQQAQQLHDMLKDGEELAPHVAGAIKSAAGSLEEVFKAIIYDKQNPPQGI